MSTLSEIAANHAKNASARDAASARLNQVRPPFTPVFDTGSLLTTERIPAHAIAAINNNVPAQLAGYPG